MKQLEVCDMRMDGFIWSGIAIFMMICAILFYCCALSLENSILLYISLIFGVVGILLLVVSLIFMDWVQITSKR